MVGILIITHAPLGQAFIATLQHVYKRAPESVMALDVQADEDVNQFTSRAMQAVDELDDGHGVLVFTDMCGATPANCAVRLINQHPNTELIYGVSLPALLRALNYRDLPLMELANKAIEGGQRGLFVYEHVHEAAFGNPSDATPSDTPISCSETTLK